jgi:signal transduction histidine kinase
VTPDLVIHRYLQRAGARPLDRESLARVITLDADLAGYWLNVLHCPPSMTRLLAALDELSDAAIFHLAEAQAIGSDQGARISLPRWQETLQAAALAETLAPQDLDVDVRLVTILALSGVVPANHPLIQNLIDVRGARVDLFEDASSLFRLFAVAETMHLSGEHAAQQVAVTLLDVDEDAFAASLAASRSNVQGLMAQADLLETDNSPPVWIHQQVAALGRLFDHNELPAVAHQLASAAMFKQTPLVLLASESSEGGTSRVLHPLELGPDVSIRADSPLSVVARVHRQGKAETQQADSQIAVVDRQVHQWFGTDHIAVYPLRGDAGALGVVVFPVDDDSDLVAMELYVAELGRRLGVADDSSAVEVRLDQYRKREHQRLRALVHEANNPLSIVQNTLHILELRLQHEPEAVKQLELVAAEVTRAADLFAQAREMSPIDDEIADTSNQAADLLINDLAREVVALHRDMADERGIGLSFDLTTAEPVLHTSESHLKQILVNLVKNALEACAPEDQVTVRTSNAVFRQGQRMLEICVEDNGPGLPDAVLDKLTDAKEGTQGSGLGLQIVHQLAADIGAEIDVRTDPSWGTAISVYIRL